MILDKHFTSLYTFRRVSEWLPQTAMPTPVTSALRVLPSHAVMSCGSTDECGLRWTEGLYSILSTCRLNLWFFADLMQGAVKSFLYDELQDLLRHSELKR